MPASTTNSPDGFVADDGFLADPEPPVRSAAGRFASGLASTTIEPVKAMLQPPQPGEVGAYFGPGGRMLEGTLRQMGAKLMEAWKAGREGKPLSALKAVAEATPAGQMLAPIAETAATGDIAGATGAAAGLTATAMAPKLIPPAARAVGRVGRGVAAELAVPGTRQAAVGTGQAVTGAGAVLTGHPWGLAGMWRGAENVIQGLAKRKATLTEKLTAARDAIEAETERAADQASRADWEKLQEREAAAAETAAEAAKRAAMVTKANEEAAAEATKGDVSRLQDAAARKALIERTAEQAATEQSTADAIRLGAAPPVDAALEAVAEGQWRKSFANLTPEQQAAAREIARRIAGGEVEGSAAPPGRPKPTAAAIARPQVPPEAPPPEEASQTPAPAPEVAPAIPEEATTQAPPAKIEASMSPAEFDKQLKALRRQARKKATKVPRETSAEPALAQEEAGSEAFNTINKRQVIESEAKAKARTETIKSNARAQRAMAIAEFLKTGDISATEAAGMNPEQQALALEGARRLYAEQGRPVKFESPSKPSESWGLVVKHLRMLELTK